MGLKSYHIENQKQSAERRLAARQELLRSKGFDERAMERDPLIRKAKAQLRRTVRRLERVAELEKQSAELARAKAGGGGASEEKKKDSGKKEKSGGKPEKKSEEKKPEKKEEAAS